MFLFRSEGGVEWELGRQMCVESAVVQSVKLKLLIYISRKEAVVVVHQRKMPPEHLLDEAC